MKEPLRIHGRMTVESDAARLFGKRRCHRLDGGAWSWLAVSPEHAAVERCAPLQFNREFDRAVLTDRQRVDSMDHRGLVNVALGEEHVVPARIGANQVEREGQPLEFTMIVARDRRRPVRVTREAQRMRPRAALRARADEADVRTGDWLSLRVEDSAAKGRPSFEGGRNANGLAVAERQLLVGQRRRSSAPPQAGTAKFEVPASPNEQESARACLGLNLGLEPVKAACIRGSTMKYGTSPPPPHTRRAVDEVDTDVGPPNRGAGHLIDSHEFERGHRAMRPSRDAQPNFAACRMRAREHVLPRRRIPGRPPWRARGPG